MATHKRMDKKRTVALFGGSFNPPHPEHFEMMRYIYQKLGVDEVWMLFSTNRLKDSSKYETVRDRQVMADLIRPDYNDVPIVYTDIQEKVKHPEVTYFALKELSEQHPDTQFIWVMGADCLANFHQWKYGDDIMRHYPVAVLNRQGYMQAALLSESASQYSRFSIEEIDKLKQGQRGWCFLADTPSLNMSSSHLLERMRADQRSFGNAFDDVAAYIRQKGLYGFSKVKPPILSI